MNIKLKPCPFCGSEIDFNKAYEDDGGFFYPAKIYCPRCGVKMTGGYKKLKYDDKGHLDGAWLTEEELNKYDNELAESWNRRYVPEPHGRLIDADEIEKLYDLDLRVYPKNYVKRGISLREILSDAPTVIEAEGTENEHID